MYCNLNIDLVQPCQPQNLLRLMPLLSFFVHARASLVNAGSTPGSDTTRKPHALPFLALSPPFAFRPARNLTSTYAVIQDGLLAGSTGLYRVNQWRVASINSHHTCAMTRASGIIKQSASISQPQMGFTFPSTLRNSQHSLLDHLRFITVESFVHNFHP
jgi:hypothetical protein